MQIIIIIILRQDAFIHSLWLSEWAWNSIINNITMIIVVYFVEERTLPSCRKLLILINPFSGSGKSLKVFHEQVEPMLNEADVEFEHKITGKL